MISKPLLFDRAIQRRILVSDIDGTLVSEAGELAPSLDDLYQLCTTAEAIVVVATSRPPHDISELIRAESPDFAICFDGCLIAQHSAGTFEPMIEEFLEAAIVVLAVDRLNGIGHPAMVFSGERADYGIYAVDSQGQYEHVPVLREHFSGGRVIECLESLPTSVTSGFRSVSLFGRMNEVESAFETLSNVEWPVGTRLMRYPETRALSDYGWLDIMPDVSKGSTLEVLLRQPGRDVERDIVCLGNGINDLSMFALADLSLSPSDGVPELKAKASRVLRGTGGEKFVREAIGVLRERWLS